MSDPDTGRGPVEEATARLAQWLHDVAGGDVRVGVPSRDATDDGAAAADVTLWPYELRAQRQTTGTGARHPYRFTVRYVVAAGPAALDRVLVAAVRAGEPVVSLDGLDSSAWLAAGAVPRPVLVLEVPAVVTYPVTDIPLVRGPLTLHRMPLGTLTGTVLGPDDQPVAAARVEAAGSTTVTDDLGRFRLAGVPPQPTRVRVEGRGRAFTAEIDPSGASPVVIRCTFPD